MPKSFHGIIEGTQIISLQNVGDIWALPVVNFKLTIIIVFRSEIKEFHQIKGFF